MEKIKLIQMRNGEILMESWEVDWMVQILNNILTHETIKYLHPDSLEFLIDKVNFMEEKND